MKFFVFISISVLVLTLGSLFSVKVTGGRSSNSMLQPKNREESLMIDKERALAIAKEDASTVYRDISIYKVRAELKENNWYIDYELINPALQGGGPHYIISGSTGEIISKRYEQ
jgi:hypothetical protein